jgi:hypothetical protein
MSGRVFEKGAEGFADKTIGWSVDTINAVLMTPTADTGIRIITGVTNANPAVFTSVAHGLSVNDVVCTGGILGNLAANQLALVATTPTADTFTLKTLKDNLPVQGSGAYTSGGWIISLMSQFRDAFDAAQTGTPQVLGSKTKTNGILDAADVSFTAITGTIIGSLIYKDSSSAAADRNLVWHDGRIQVVCAGAVSTSATSIPVEQLDSDLPSGAVLAFSNGVLATLSAPATYKDRTVTVSAIAAGIAAGHTAEGPVTNNNLPFTFNGVGGVTTNITWGQFIARI